MTFSKLIHIRSDKESHRQASWVELFIDLAFVVSIASMAQIFENGFTWLNIFIYSIIFFVVFWIWNKFTWYSAFYANDDVPFRIIYLTLIFPVLGVVSSLEDILAGNYFNAIVFYIAINVLLLILWGRVLLSRDKLKRNAKSFFLGYLISIILLVISLFVDTETKYILWIFAFLSEFFGPLVGWYLSKSKIPVHTDHIVERHGLFTIILLGEGLVSIASNFQSVFHSGYWFVLLAAFVVIICIWWLYFDCGFGFTTNLSKNIWRTFIFGYGQFLVFLSIVFTSIGLEYGMHHLVDHKNDGLLEGKVILFAMGCFVLMMSIIQLMISKQNPKSIYIPRFIVGCFLVVTSLLINMDYNYQYILLLSAFVLPLTINDIIQWHTFKNKYLEVRKTES